MMLAALSLCLQLHRRCRGGGAGSAYVSCNTGTAGEVRGVGIHLTCASSAVRKLCCDQRVPVSRGSLTAGVRVQFAALHRSACGMEGWQFDACALGTWVVWTAHLFGMRPNKHALVLSRRFVWLCVVLSVWRM